MRLTGRAEADGFEIRSVAYNNRRPRQVVYPAELLGNAGRDRGDHDRTEDELAFQRAYHRPVPKTPLQPVAVFLGGELMRVIAVQTPFLARQPRRQRQHRPIVRQPNIGLNRPRELVEPTNVPGHDPERRFGQFGGRPHSQKQTGANGPFGKFPLSSRQRARASDRDPFAGMTRVQAGACDLAPGNPTATTFQPAR